jgi:hypothetical protein
MTEHLLLGRADPLGHIVLVENHGHDCSLDRCTGIPEDISMPSAEEPCLRSARSIVLSVRTHVITGFGR